MKPTDIHPGLQEERLVIIGQLITAARHAAVSDHKPSEGDNNWVLGCRCYAWACHGVRRATERYPEWLTIIEDGLHFVFGIGGVPLRFYRGEPDDVPERTMSVNLPELRARQDAFSFAAQYRSKTHLRLAVETDSLGEVSTITLIEVDEGLNPVGDGWVIPRETGKVVQFPTKEEGKDLGQPPIVPKAKPETEDGEKK